MQVILDFFMNALRPIYQALAKPIIAAEQRFFHNATFVIEDSNYIFRSTSNFLAGDLNRTSLATVFAVNPGDDINITSLRDKISLYTANDDVFRTEFLTGIILQGAEKAQLNFNLDLTVLSQELGSKWINIRPISEQSPKLSPGPYAVQNGQLFQVWRLYSDKNLAFLQSVWPANETLGEYTEVPYTGKGYRTLSIAVPSKLYSSHPKPLPLEGTRVAIKDLYSLKGLRTSVCNRAYNALCPPQQTTSETIANLISLGVNIVGKNHLSSFALQEHPTQSVDYESPFNPRADGYQIPGGSSSGSASAIASYDWLDFAIGTDSTGSIRIPALANGCFGLRPSTGAVSTEGVVSVYPGFDTPGLLGRDLERFHNFVSHWYGPNAVKKPISSPKLLFPPDFMTSINPSQTNLIEGYVKDLERSLDAVVERKSIAETWSYSSPVEEKDLNVYLQNATLDSFYYEAFHAFGEFRKSYESKFGRKPFVTEVVRSIWQSGSQVSEAQYQETSERISIFKDWFLKEYMGDGERSSILVLPISNVTPNYRDVYPGAPSPAATGLRTTYLSPYLGAPELAIPIGDIEYESRISGNLEYLPVAISLMSPPESDLALIQLAVDSLQKCGRPTKVQAGTARMWDYRSKDIVPHHEN